MIKQHQQTYSTQLMCRLLLVSASGDSAWLNRRPSLRAQSNARLSLQIDKLFQQEKGRAGSPRITQQLHTLGETVGRHRVARIMREHGWRAKGRKKYKVTTDSNHLLPIAPNLLQRDFSSQQRNEKWVSDITYMWTEEGWLYLAVIMDLYSRKIVGWALDERMKADLVISALEMALSQRSYPKATIIHSDRGRQYCAEEYQKLFEENRLICSMSRRGDCYDNAAMESWNHSFKVEAIHGEKFLTREQAKQHIFEYIEVYYNRQQLHSTLGYRSTVQFEEMTLN